MKLRDQLLIVSRTYCNARGLSLARVSTLVFNEGKKLGAVELGSDLATGRFETAMAWFSANWPAGAAWPEKVMRPSVALGDPNPSPIRPSGS